MEMYAVLENNFDDERIQFYFDEEKAFEDFKELKEDFEPSISRGAAIFKITGEGALVLGRDIEGYDGVELLSDFDEYSI